MTPTPAFDALASVLFEGPIKAVDIHLIPGTQEGRSREELASALLASMSRVGLVRDGRLVPPQEAGRCTRPASGISR